MQPLFLLVLLVATTQSSVGFVPAIKIGALFPLIKRNGAIDNGGRKRFHAFKMALAAINDKTDGIFDDLLPHTRLNYSLRDSKRDSGDAALGALALTRPPGEGVAAVDPASLIIGPASSSPSIRVHNLLSIFTPPVAQVGYSATSARLSDAEHPFFARTPPSDSQQSEFMASWVASTMGWTDAVTLNGDDAYSVSGIQDFRLFASVASAIRIHVAQTFAERSPASVVRSVLEVIKETSVKLIVIFCQTADLITVLRSAGELEMLGEHGYTWLISEAVIGSYSDLIEGFDGDRQFLDRALRGAWSLAPSNGEGTEAFGAFVERWRRSEPSVGLGANCSLEVDDDGLLVHVQDTREGRQGITLRGDEPLPPPEARACTGISAATLRAPGSVTQYVPFAYDAVLAVAHALDRIVRDADASEAPPALDGGAVLAALTRVTFDGVTGRVSFDEGGDRSKEGIKFILHNHQPEHQFRPVGTILLNGAITDRVLPDSEWEFARSDAELGRDPGLLNVPLNRQSKSPHSFALACPPSIPIYLCSGSDILCRPVAAYNASVSQCNDDNVRVVRYFTEETPCVPGELSFGEDTFFCSDVPWDSHGGRIVIGIVATFSLVNTAIFAALVVKRHHIIIKATQQRVSLVIAFSAVAMNLCILVLLGDNTNGMCIGRIWGVTLFPCLGLSSLLAKTYRVHCIFNNTSLKKIRMTTAYIAKLVAASMALQLFLLLLWTAADTPEARVRANRYKFEFRAEFCGDGRAGCGAAPTEARCDDSVFMYLQGIYLSSIVLATCILSYLSRNVPGAFHEARWIMAAAYNAVITIFFLGVFLFATSDGQDRKVTIVMFAVAAAWTSTTLNCLLFLPKFYSIATSTMEQCKAELDLRNKSSVWGSVKAREQIMQQQRAELIAKVKELEAHVARLEGERTEASIAAAPAAS